MNEQPACPIVLVFPEAGADPPPVLLLNDSDKTAVSMTYLAGTIN